MVVTVKSFEVGSNVTLHVNDNIDDIVHFQTSERPTISYNIFTFL